MALTLGLLIQDVYAQQNPRRGQQPPRRQPPPNQPQRGQGQQPQQRQAQQAEDSEPFLDNVIVGGGLSAFFGDVTYSPSSASVATRVATSDLNLVVGLDKRFGEYSQFSLESRLKYEGIGGKTSGVPGANQPLSFNGHLVSLDVLGMYELPIIEPNFLHVFAGGGVSAIVSPSYEGYPEEAPSDSFEPNAFQPDLGTRPVATGTVGVSFFEVVRIGTRYAATDVVDGYKGFRDPSFPTDTVYFITFNHRFSLGN